MEQEPTVMRTRIVFLIARILQFILATAILGIGAYLLTAEAPSYWSSAPALGVATAVLTWLIVAYAFLSEKVSVFKVIYNAYAVLALDLFLIIMWLSTMGLNAARAAKFFKPFSGLDDFDFGDVGGSSSGGGGGGGGRNCVEVYGEKVCFKAKRDITSDLLNNGNLYGHLLITIAVFSALEFLLFIATFVALLFKFIRTRRHAQPPAAPVQMAPAPAVMPQNTGTVPVDAKYGYPVQTVDPAMQTMPAQTYQPAPQYGQPQYEQPQYGQPPYGQPQYAQQVPHTQ